MRGSVGCDRRNPPCSSNKSTCSSSTCEPNAIGSSRAKKSRSQAGTASASQAGTLVYLNAGASLDAALGRLERAGGRLVTPPVDLPGDMGRYAHVADSEGNRVGLHAMR